MGNIRIEEVAPAAQTRGRFDSEVLLALKPQARRSFSLASASGQEAEEIVREALPELQPERMLMAAALAAIEGSAIAMASRTCPMM